MNQRNHQQIPPQKDVLTVQEAKTRVGNWHQLAGQVYNSKDSKKNMPHGIFIPFIDILEIGKLQQSITIKPGTDERIYIVGVRAYYCLKNPVVIHVPPIPISAVDFPIEAVLVPVYQTNARVPGSPGEYDYDANYLTYDLITPVDSVNDKDAPGSTEYATIYDVTRPCPNLCDTESPLF